jgi:putative DNA methylase
MVDDPSEYVDELLADSQTRAKAETELGRRIQEWHDLNATYDTAVSTGGTPMRAPGPEPTLEDCAVDIERDRLFKLVEQLVKWENTTNEAVLQTARDEIRRSWRRACADNRDHPRAAELFNPEKLPPFHDPFAGGGSLPLEAQRLGLEANASDLNPVAVLINKAMIEIPPKFAGRPPVNPEVRNQPRLMAQTWKRAQGLAEDVRYYGKWMRDEGEKRIGHLYPKVEITKEMAAERPDLKPLVGQKLTVIAWIWARTVKSPNPAFSHVDVPLATTFMLSTKPGKEAYVEPVVEGDSYHFTVRVGRPKSVEAAMNGTKLGRGASFRCLLSDAPMSQEYVREQFRAKRVGDRLLAVVAEGNGGRAYLSPLAAYEELARQRKPDWYPEQEMNQLTPNLVSGRGYGVKYWHEIFTPRQLVALTTFSDLVQETRGNARQDAIAAGFNDDGLGLDAGGTGAQAYGDAVALYLAFAVSKAANVGSSITSWMSDRGAFRETFARQAIPMIWDYAESNPLADAGGSLRTAIEKGAMVAESLPEASYGHAYQADAATEAIRAGTVIATDPPYYDNIGYADLSDFFYVWLRRSLRSIFPDLFLTIAVPKNEELVATPYRHGSEEKAREFFLDGMTRVFKTICASTHPAFPTTIYYAFKQAETDTDAAASTGWEVFLNAVRSAGLIVTGTWPMRTEGSGRILARDTNALASSVVLVCRTRSADAHSVTRRQFITDLRREVPVALKTLQSGNIAPVDLAQAAIGPGMAVYTRYSEVVDTAGSRVTVRDALTLINQVLGEVLAEQESEFDADTRFALTWFEQYGFARAEYGVAETLSKARDTSVSGMVQAGILEAAKGKVRLLKPSELPVDWDPVTDKRLTVWETVHHLIRVLETISEEAASELLSRLGGQAEAAKDLAYRLFTICERKGWSQEALSYNSLVYSWPEMARLSGRRPGREIQAEMFGGEQ